MNENNIFRFILTLLVGVVLVSCSNDGDDTGTVAASCSVAAPEALRTCINGVNSTTSTCYEDGNQACDESAFASALATLKTTVERSCAAGDISGLSVKALVGRLDNSCQSQSDSIAWRTYGGPQGAVWSDANASDKDCLLAAHATVSSFFDASLAAVNECLANDDCDAEAVTEQQRLAASEAADTVVQSCGMLENLIAVNAQTYIERAENQIDCTLATSHEDTAPFSPSCGPSYAEPVPPRGIWTQIILDGDKWGSMCGDGTDYAIQVRLAPEGQPLDRVMVALQGGGVCILSQCAGRFESNPGLFNAQDDEPLGNGLVSDDPVNPFANWTKIYLPYCNQDVFIGGGVVEQIGDLALPRYGTINLRAGVRAARDIIWKAMDAEGGGGFRPDNLVALFGGFSAGGYGTLYNYHWMLDDLQWPRTAAFPDAGGALDNSGVGVRTLGDSMIPLWGARPYLPPYCFTGDCAVGPDNYMAFSPRLKQVPEQQYLILSNQKDNTQQGDAFFTDEAQWIDAMRSAYCETKDLPGIQFYLTSESKESVHVVSIRNEFYYGEVAGERMVDWFVKAVSDPDSVTDWAEEGDFTTDIPGSSAFPCELP